MKILSIETSCDETGVSIIEGMEHNITVCGNALASQVDIHEKYGGVFPALAKRAHGEKIITLLAEALDQAGMLHVETSPISDDLKKEIFECCKHEGILAQKIIEFVETHGVPTVEYIAVTSGPGLEPALWVGINTAKALSIAWNIALIPINHMEGHVLVSLMQEVAEKKYSLLSLTPPALALLVSGGHTELVLIHDYARYEKIGHTRDDAVGEAFDKVARMLGLPYPGGPAISNLAAQFRKTKHENQYIFPRPMMHSGDYDFSYSGIKTAVLYKIKEMPEISQDQKMAIAAAFEDAAIEVLVAKTLRAISHYHIAMLIVGGGVAGNTYLRAQLIHAVQNQFPQVTVLFPQRWLATDNSVMIAIAAYTRAIKGAIESQPLESIKADGNLSITDGGYRK